MEWLEISLTVSGELAEAVAEVLSRYCANGVIMEQGIGYLDEADVGAPDGPITVRAYVPGDDRQEETRRRIEEALHFLGVIQPLPAPAFRTVQDANWMEAWREHYHPIPIGRRLVVLPAWMEAADAARIPIRIDPGMAFGTGTHPSTQLCLEFLDEILGKESGQGDMRSSAFHNTLIDIGCGSGILSIAAVKLGVANVLGVDIDATSVQNARENALLNQIGSELVLGEGSVAEIRKGQFALRKAPLVTVNILAPVIIELLEEGLADVLEPGGLMVLAGILESQASAVKTAAERQGLVLKKLLQRGDWIALEMSH